MNTWPTVEELQERWFSDLPEALAALASESALKLFVHSWGDLTRWSCVLASDPNAAKLTAASVAGWDRGEDTLFEIRGNLTDEELDLLECCRSEAEGNNVPLLLGMLKAVAVQRAGKSYANRDLPSLDDVRAHFEEEGRTSLERAEKFIAKQEKWCAAQRAELAALRSA